LIIASLPSGGTGARELRHATARGFLAWMLALMAMRNYASFAPSGTSGRKKVRASPALAPWRRSTGIPSTPPVAALADEGALGVKACGRVPVAQLDSSSGFLIRRSQVRVLPGTPLRSNT
jgi:hypothetical protein